MPLLDSIMSFPQRFTAAPFNVTFNNVAGTLLVVGVEIEDGATVAVTGITYNSIAMIKIDNQSWNTNAEDVSWWYLNAPATGSNTIAVSTSGTINGLYVTAASLTGADAKDPVRQSAKATALSALPSVTLNNVLTGSVCFDLVGTGAGVLGWGQNLIWVDNNSGTTGGDNVASQYAVGNGNQNAVMNYSVTSDLWGMVAFEVQGPVGLSEGAQAFDAVDAYGPFHAAATAFQSTVFQSNVFQIFGGSAGGGGPSTYNEVLGETAIAADLISASQAMLASLSETGVASDSIASAQAMLVGLVEGGQAADGLTTSMKMLAGLLEASQASDAVTAAQVFGAAMSESSTAAESLATIQIMLASLSETAVASDSAIGLLQIPVSLSESALADCFFDATVTRPGGGGNVYNEGLLEACAALDALASRQAMGAGVSAVVPASASAQTTIFIFDD